MILHSCVLLVFLILYIVRTFWYVNKVVAPVFVPILRRTVQISLTKIILSMSKEIIYKIVQAICTAILTIAGVLLMQSCSTTKATIMSARDAASTTITITTANPVSADTKVDANGTINPIK